MGKATAVPCGAMYTVRKVRADNTGYGLTHGSDAVIKTVCGREIDSHWYVETNAFDGVISCKTCLKNINATHHG